MRTGMLLALGGPALAALSALAGASRVWRAAGMIGGVAGSAWILALAARDGSVSWRGFHAEPFHAGMALAIVAIAASEAVRMAARDRGSEGARDAAGGAAAAAAIAAAVGSVLAVHLALTAAFLVATTAAIGVATAVRGTRAAVRVFSLLALSDLLAVPALALAAREGAMTPPVLTGGAAWLLAAAAVLRATAVGATRWTGAWLVAPTAPRAAVLGAVRVQGVLMAVWVAGSGGAARTALTVTAATVAAVAAARAARWHAWDAGLAAQTALAVAALGIGTPGGVLAALLIAVGVAVATTGVLAGARGTMAPSVGATALGATFAGVALAVTEAGARAVVDRPFAVVALSMLAAALWLAHAGAVGSGRGEARGAAILPAGLALGVAATMAILPGSVAARLQGVVASLSAAPALAHAMPAVGDRVGIAFALGALAALAVRGVPADPPPAPEPLQPADPPEPAAVRASWAAEAAAGLAVLAAMAASIDRGWL